MVADLANSTASLSRRIAAVGGCMSWRDVLFFDRDMVCTNRFLEPFEALEYNLAGYGATVRSSDSITRRRAIVRSDYYGRTELSSSAR